MQLDGTCKSSDARRGRGYYGCFTVGWTSLYRSCSRNRDDQEQNTNINISKDGHHTTQYGRIQYVAQVVSKPDQDTSGKNRGIQRLGVTALL